RRLRRAGVCCGARVQQPAGRGEPDRVRVGGGDTVAPCVDRADRDLRPLGAGTGGAVTSRQGRPSRRRVALHLFLAVVALLWLLPVAWAVYTSFRPYADTAARGYVSAPGAVSLAHSA